MRIQNGYEATCGGDPEVFLYLAVKRFGGVEIQSELGRLIQRFTDREEICEWVITYQCELIEGSSEDAEEVMETFDPTLLEHEVTLLSSKNELEWWLSEKMLSFFSDHYPEPAARNYALEIVERCMLSIAAEEIDIEHHEDSVYKPQEDRVRDYVLDAFKEAPISADRLNQLVSDVVAYDPAQAED